jgi:ferredoxin
MPIISISSTPRKQVNITLNTNLFSALIKASVPVGTACRGSQICGKCTVIASPSSNISRETTTERLCKHKNNVPKRFRLSCCCTVLGDIDIILPN